MQNPILGERSSTLIGADFPNRASAMAAADMLREDPMLEGEVAVVGPNDPLTDQKMEPEENGIWKTLVRSHLILGGLGLLTGALATATAVYVLEWQAAVASPWFALLFFSVIGTVFGMLAAGLVTMRPDHGVVIARLERALGRDRWAVIVRPRDESPALSAMALLKECGGRPSRSL